MALPDVRLDLHKNIQPDPTTTYSGIFPHQIASQILYLLGIIINVILDTSNGTKKVTTAKKSGNLDRWCTFLTQSGIP